MHIYLNILVVSLTVQLSPIPLIRFVLFLCLRGDVRKAVTIVNMGMITFVSNDFLQLLVDHVGTLGGDTNQF